MTLAGCGSEPEVASARAALDVPPHAAPGFTCFIAAKIPGPPSNPWQPGQYGYVIYNPVTWPVHDDQPQLWAVLGMDATLTNVIWRRTVATQAEARTFLTLPQTMHFSCPLMCEAGQVTTGGQADTGNTTDGMMQVCFADKDLERLRTSCQCQPYQADAVCGLAVCGGAPNGCGGQVSCGTCHLLGTTCEDGECVCHKTCPKGSYLDPDGPCRCIKGTPQ